jgi:hypothetical protein
METTAITKTSPGLKSKEEIVRAPKLFVNHAPPQPQTIYCGLLQSTGSSGDTSFYSVIGNGCVTIYLTDDQGVVESATEYTCIRGNTLSVEGYHSFGWLPMSELRVQNTRDASRMGEPTKCRHTPYEALGAYGQAARPAASIMGKFN